MRAYRLAWRLFPSDLGRVIRRRDRGVLDDGILEFGAEREFSFRKPVDALVAGHQLGLVAEEIMFVLGERERFDLE